MKHINHSNILLLLCSGLVIRSLVNSPSLSESLFFLVLVSGLCFHNYLTKHKEDKVASLTKDVERLEKDNKNMSSHINTMTKGIGKKLDSFKF